MKIAAMFLIFVSLSANAFQAVTEILPDGKLLICQAYGENEKKVVRLPAVGSKVSLYHKDFNVKRKVTKEMHDAKIGEAIVVERKTVNEQRCVVAATDKHLVVDELAAVDW